MVKVSLLDHIAGMRSRNPSQFLVPLEGLRPVTRLSGVFGIQTVTLDGFASPRVRYRARRSDATRPIWQVSSSACFALPEFQSAAAWRRPVWWMFEPRLDPRRPRLQPKRGQRKQWPTGIEKPLSYSNIILDTIHPLRTSRRAAPVHPKRLRSSWRCLGHLPSSWRLLYVHPQWADRSEPVHHGKRRQGA